MKNFTGSFSGHERNAFFLRGSKSYVDAAHGLGLAFDHDGRAVAPIDVDGDGDLDLAAMSLQGFQLLENTSPPRGWVRFSLRATTTEPHALGATVKIRAGARSQVDRVRLTAGFHTQVSREVHFGLADATRVDEVEVRWPSGEVQRFSDLAANTRYQLVEGQAAASPRPMPTWPAGARPRVTGAFTLDVPLRTLEGEATKLEPKPVATVLNFWAPWCVACKREVPALAKLARSRGDAVRVVGVSVETKKLGEVRAFVAEHGLDYPLRLATDDAVAAFFGPGGKMTLPATFVFDARGRLRRSHFREVDIADLDATLDTLTAPPSARDRSELAVKASKAGDPSKALALLEEAVRLDPNSARFRWQLGLASIQHGKHAAGLAALEAAVRIAPDDDGFISDLAGGYQAAGQGKRGLALLEESVKRWPKSSRLWRDLAVLYEQLDQREPARQAYVKSLRLRPFQPPVWRRRADLEARMGRRVDSAYSMDKYESQIGKRGFEGE